MKRLIIIFLSIISLFVVSCNYQILNPNDSNSSNNSSSEGNSGENNSGNGSGNNSGENNSGEDNGNSENITKTMYFKFKVSGKSSQKAFNRNNIFPKELSIKNYVMTVLSRIQVIGEILDML